jgi:hypothetical protein
MPTGTTVAVGRAVAMTVPMSDDPFSKQVGFNPQHPAIQPHQAPARTVFMYPTRLALPDPATIPSTYTGRRPAAGSSTAC